MQLALIATVVALTVAVASANNYGQQGTGDELCWTFGAHARTAMTVAGVAPYINGHIGVSPGTSYSGAFSLLDGDKLSAAQASPMAAHVVTMHAEAMAVDVFEPLEVEIGGKTFLPGFYASTSAINLAGLIPVTLDADGDADATFTFRAETTFITAALTSVVLTNGAQAKNVRWVLGTGATFGAGSDIQGSILAGTTCVFGASAVLHGCALAGTGVTFGSGVTIVNNFIAK